ncbi:AMP deaminase [Citrus sinensis]|uniref:AMP deaminase n=1 Tax=Citrus sinensis TaxID=2711 RepID=A0ACB8LK35_CITSI|nr:AMP deaminase [Citrus sinensis]
MDPSSTSSLQLAMAALVGASLMAISAFYIHKRAVDQVLDRLVEIRRKHPQKSDTHFEEEEGEEEDGDTEEGDFEEDFGSDGDAIMRQQSQSRLSRSLEDSTLRRYGISSSLPNVSVRNDWLEEDAKFDEAIRVRAQNCSASSLDKLNFIPTGLPSLQTPRRLEEGQSINRSGSGARLVSLGRLPRTPVGNAFEDSDEDGTEHANEDDITYSNENVDAFAYMISDADSKVQSSSALPFRGDGMNYVQDKNYRATINDAKPALDLHDNGKVDKASRNAVGTETILYNTISQLRTTVHEPTNIEEEEVWKMIQECLDLRKRYVFTEKVAPWMKEAEPETNISEMRSDPFHFVPVEASKHHFRMEDGVVHVYASESDTTELFPVASATEFFTDMHHILRIMSIGNVRTACHHRLRFLEEKFRLHLLVNADGEFLAQKSAPHRDFYNIRKVDTHVHHSACMNQKHLLRFIKSKLRKEPDEVVIFRDGKYMTLKEVFESLDLTGYDLNVDLLDVHADKSTFHRFDKFNLKYNPCGQSRLREIFLKQDNLIQEYRVSIYGRKQSEWDQLASWFINNEIYSENAIWLIQLPRLYNVYKQMGIVKSFQNIIDNVFIPLFEVTIDPSSHPQLHVFLLMAYMLCESCLKWLFSSSLCLLKVKTKSTIEAASDTIVSLSTQVVGFDLVDDESKPERRPTKHMPKPAEWTNEFNPAYSYYTYYFYANLYTLNKLRESKGMPTIKLRPHCGEAGEIDHLAAAFLLCNNISHGIHLRKSPVLQYLYYLAQIGLAMSPLSNNSLFLDYHRNPFPMFFQRGLNVSLSSDDPLQIHLTKEALVEEYSVAAKVYLFLHIALGHSYIAYGSHNLQVWKLSSCDLCEIARNSVYQSGFSHMAKSHWLGNKFFIRGPEGNDIHKTNVPNIRIEFRHETWKEEMQYVYLGRAIIPVEIDT